MSLLMDALKQAEFAKRGKQPETSPPPETPAAPAAVEDIAEAPAQLSLAPVEASPQVETEPSPISDAAGATPEQPAELLNLVIETTPEPSQPANPEVATMPATSGISGQPADRSAHAAARILAASASRLAAQRRRNLLGVAALGALLALAIGIYYYYAALAQTQPYLAPPQPATLATEPAPASTATEQTMMQPPARTDWRQGPEPVATETQPWEPAPVDPAVIRSGVIRGEQAPATPDTTQDLSADMSRNPPAGISAAPPAPAAPAPSIRITRGSQPSKVSGLLSAAYADYHNGRWSQAEQGYRDVLAREPDNRDARLGLAALSVRAEQLDVARQQYRELLRRNPKDAAALAALSDLNQSPTVNSESLLKSRLAEQPESAQLHFALANLYAGQQRWPLAQQAYFEAQRLAPGNPDYAFNLAVSLEHLGQSRLALDYYRRALQLAGVQAAQFETAVAQQRVIALSTQNTP